MNQFCRCGAGKIGWQIIAICSILTIVFVGRFLSGWQFFARQIAGKLPSERPRTAPDRLTMEDQPGAPHAATWTRPRATPAAHGKRPGVTKSAAEIRDNGTDLGRLGRPNAPRSLENASNQRREP